MSEAMQGLEGPTETVEVEEINHTASTDAKLEEAKGNFAQAVIIGVKPNGAIDVVTNVNTFERIQALLSRTAFEMHIIQRNAENQPAPEGNK